MGNPMPGPGMRYPLSAGWCTPKWTWDGVPPVSWIGYPTWDGVPPVSWMGYPHLDLGWGDPLPGLGMWYPHQLDGVPPPGPGMEYPGPDLGWSTPPSAGWGTLHLDLGWGTSIQTWGTCYPDLGWGTPYQLDGVPPAWTWDGVPYPDLGYPLSRPGMGYPLSRCELTNKLKTVPSPILWMQAVISIN